MVLTVQGLIQTGQHFLHIKKCCDHIAKYINIYIFSYLAGFLVIILKSMSNMEIGRYNEGSVSSLSGFRISYLICKFVLKFNANSFLFWVFLLCIDLKEFSISARHISA